MQLLTLPIYRNAVRFQSSGFAEEANPGKLTGIAENPEWIAGPRAIGKDKEGIREAGAFPFLHPPVAPRGTRVGRRL